MEHGGKVGVGASPGFTSDPFFSFALPWKFPSGGKKNANTGIVYVMMILC